MIQALSKNNIFSLTILLLFSLSSCRIMNPSIMFKTKEEQKSNEQQTTLPKNYLIRPGDKIAIKVLSNNGYELVNVFQPAGTSTAYQAYETEYLINTEGYAKLPLIDTIYLTGKTISQTEKLLQEKYALYFKDPFVIIRVTNRRVIIFSGEKATVVPFNNENMTLVEALAQAGGLSVTGKAYKIKLIRGNLSNPEVTMIDLSTIEGMKKSNLTLQANDIVYVEPIIKLTTGIINELNPIVGILTGITSILLIYQLLK